MFENLKKTKRLLLEADLIPVQGERFQPTGFPDLGAATYQLPNGTRMLLVESAQSIANHLEATIINSENDLDEEFKGLSYIKTKLTKATDTYTNSLIEAHRINSPFIISDKKFQEMFVKDAHYEPNKPINWQKVACALFKYDVNSLLHGTFLANLGDGRLKIPRALSGFIEARNVREVVSGGVKFNPIDPTGKLRAENYDKDVYGNVPYQRVEYTAERITAYFNVDVGLLQSYALGEAAFDLLMTLSLYKIQSFLLKGTRLRTACDLKVKEVLKAIEPIGFIIPDREALLAQIKEKILACKAMFAKDPVTVITMPTVKKETSSKEIE
jgi:CRISPR-associated protein Csb1